jgi:hypothetical protein
MKLGPVEIGWDGVAQVRDKRRGLVNPVMNLRLL